MSSIIRWTAQTKRRFVITNVVVWTAIVTLLLPLLSRAGYGFIEAVFCLAWAALTGWVWSMAMWHFVLPSLRSVSKAREKDE